MGLFAFIYRRRGAPPRRPQASRRWRGLRWAGVLLLPVLLVPLLATLAEQAVGRALPGYARRLGYDVTVGEVQIRLGRIGLSDLHLIARGRPAGSSDEVVLSQTWIDVPLRSALASALGHRPVIERVAIDGGVVRLPAGAAHPTTDARGSRQDPALRVLNRLRSLRPSAASGAPGDRAGLLPQEVLLNNIALQLGPLRIGGVAGELHRGGDVELRLGGIHGTWRAVRFKLDGIRVSYVAAPGGYLPENGLPSVQVDGAAALLAGQPLWQTQGPLRGSLLTSDDEFQLELGDGSMLVGATLGLSLRDGDVVFDLRSELAGLDLSHPVLASTPVRDMGLRLVAAGSYQPGGHLLRLDKGAVRIKGLEVALRGEVKFGDGPTLGDWRRSVDRVDLHVSVPPMPCQALLDAVPRDLVPALAGFALSGQLAADVAIDIDLLRIVRADDGAGPARDPVQVVSKIDVDRCTVLHAPAQSSVERLRRPFWHQVHLSGGRLGPRVYLGPGSPDYVSFADISPYLVNSVITTEDDEFMSHQGVSGTGLVSALREDLMTGNFSVGGSSITMQLVKNLLLSPERTVSRKLQEMFLAWYLDRHLGKTRILELYLNVAELGPSLYGVRRGASHFFGKSPAELLPREGAWISFLLPSPRRRYAAFCKGRLDKEKEERLGHILTRMYRLGRLTEEEFQEAIQQHIIFRRPRCEQDGAS